MSGRAGRRGLDDRGICIMMMDQDMDEDACREMVQVGGRGSQCACALQVVVFPCRTLPLASGVGRHQLAPFAEAEREREERERETLQRFVY